MRIRLFVISGKRSQLGYGVPTPSSHVALSYSLTILSWPLTHLLFSSYSYIQGLLHVVVKGWTLTGLDLTPSLTPLGCLEFDLIKPSWSIRYDIPSWSPLISPHPSHILLIASHSSPLLTAFHPTPILIILSPPDPHHLSPVLPRCTPNRCWMCSPLMTLSLWVFW